ncbi:uncharacterized protein [Drosophila kikkawai]|uniref:Uncharacterized protein n=1 Tax=Drosophila kikkawai TaxID=30033 RepID=A0A6P4I321_DROKI|nr:uncharacterized protein LOC108070846 [Drosophila kikkawai]
MFWSNLSRAFTLRQGGSRPPGKPPEKPPAPPPAKLSDKSPATPSAASEKKPCKVRTECQAARFCAEPDRFHSMWEPPQNLPPPYPFLVRRSNELCCDSNCTKPLPSFDELYYHPSCKDGPFQRTWVECPKFMFRKKVICAYDKLETLEPARRLAKKRERVSNSYPEDQDIGPCPHLAPLARCIPGRRPPRCRKDNQRVCCRKLCAPVPSWSECKKPPLARVRPRAAECECRRTISLCEVERCRQRVKIQDEPTFMCPKDVWRAKKVKRLKKKPERKDRKNKKKKDKDKK